MEKYLDSVKLKDFFLDFGGADAVGDSIFVPPTDINEIEEKIHSDEFEKLYREYLGIVLPNGLSITDVTIDDAKFYIVPNVAHLYSIAGQVALGKVSNKEGIYLGTYDCDLAKKATDLAKYANMNIKVVLGRDASKDEAAIKELIDNGAEVDAESCNTYFDIPYAYSTLSFGPASPLQVVSIDANNGAAPIPSTVGEICGLLGYDLSQKFKNISCWATNITTGTEAIAMFKSVINKDMKLITVEEPKSRELHLIDTGCYTISARYADKEEMDVTLCPELVSWWRLAKVTRLGSDTLRKVDTNNVVGDIKESTKRAIALIHKANPEIKEVLLMEVK